MDEFEKQIKLDQFKDRLMLMALRQLLINQTFILGHMSAVYPEDGKKMFVEAINMSNAINKEIGELVKTLRG